MTVSTPTSALRLKFNRSFRWLSLVVLLAYLVSCDSPAPDRPPLVPPGQKEEQEPAVNVPVFSGDSAYSFVEKQVNFGPRVPGTDPWSKCADYLSEQLKEYDFEVTVQEAEVTVYDGQKVPMKNIIGRYRPEIKNRVLLFAHWDTRPFADKDDQNKEKPIDGANDGGSGVGVILEIARSIKAASEQPNIGLDIIFFDVEDWGEPEGSYSASSTSTYCLGSQYWAKNPPIPNFKPKYGILLDMVGGKDAWFVYEDISIRSARHVAQKVWKRAAKLGYDNHFVAKEYGFYVMDDHYYVNTVARIPSIDIIEFNPRNRSFGEYHHTHDDNMSVIDKGTLKAVGQTLLEVIYRER